MFKKPDALALAKVAIVDRGIGWQADATETLKEQAAEIERLQAENKAWREQCDMLTHQVICCGVAASHPDATLTTRGAYAGK